MDWWFWVIVIIVFILVLGLFIWALFWKAPANHVVRNLKRFRLKLRLDQSLNPLIKDLIKMINQAPRNQPDANNGSANLNPGSGANPASSRPQPLSPTGNTPSMRSSRIQKGPLIDPGSIDLILQIKSIPIQVCYIDPDESETSPAPSPSETRRQRGVNHVRFDPSGIISSNEQFDEESGRFRAPRPNLVDPTSIEPEGRFKFSMSILDMLNVTKSPEYQEQKWSTDSEGNLSMRIMINPGSWTKFYLVFNSTSSSLLNLVKLVRQVLPVMIRIKLVLINGTSGPFYTLMFGKMIFVLNRQNILLRIMQKNTEKLGECLIEMDKYVPQKDDVHLDLGIGPI